MRNVFVRRCVWVAVAGLVLVTTFGCSKGLQARFVDDHRVYTLAEVDRNAAGSSSGEFAEVNVADAPKVRETVLAELRRHGPTAEKAADALTKDFPATTRAVPYYVEAATVDGKPCWVIYEASGARQGKLTMRRLWVIDRSNGGLLDARVFK